MLCLEELEDSISENIRYNAISHRMSKVDTNDFQKFLDEMKSDTEKAQPIVVDHEAQIKMAQGM